MIEIGTLTVEDAAHELVGNWKKFDCFVWHRRREIDEADVWAVVYTHNRDSGLLDLSNAEVITRKLEVFSDCDDPDVVFESHSHWAVGHVDGFSIRVFKDNMITQAFRAYHALTERLANYPILDEEDYSRREHDATFSNIEQEGSRLKHAFFLPEEWVSEVYSWLSNNIPSSVENRDDQGGCPSDEEIMAAFEALGYEPTGEE